MKKYLVVLAILGVVTVNVFAQSDAKPTAQTKVAGPYFTWETTSHDFGDIFQGDKVEYTYKFTNTGTEPIVITNVNVTCGCTTPKGWPRDPIPPGGKSEIVIAFNSAGKMGKQNKVITIISNAANENNQVVFTANVLEKKTDPQ